MKKSFTRIATGTLIILAGVAWLLNNIGIIEIGSLIGNWWPSAIILFSLLFYFGSPKNYFWLLTVLFGGILQLKEAGIVDFNPWTAIWPLLVIYLGFMYLFGKSRVKSTVSKEGSQDVAAIMGGVSQKSASKSYAGGKVTAIMGGAELDLSKVKIEKEATIEIFAFWGGIEVRVPEEVEVRNQVNNILAGTDDLTSHPAKKDAPILNIIGDVIMSGVEIRN